MLCLECFKREAVEDQDYCKQCEQRMKWINDYFDQFED